MFAFKLSNDKGQEETWHLDLKETGKVGKGEAPQGKKADGGFTLFLLTGMSWKESVVV